LVFDRTDTMRNKPLKIVLAVLGVIVLLPILALAALVLVIQSEWGERHAEQFVAGRIHRDVDINGIRVVYEWPPALSFERIRIGNPDWAKTRNLLDAQGLTARFEIPPLLARRVIVPYLEAKTAAVGLEQSGERATWRFDSEQKQPSRVVLERVAIGDGHVVYRDEDEHTALDIGVKGTLGQNGEVKAIASGTYKGEPTKGTATLPGLQPDPTMPLRFDGKATVGRTELAANGEIGSHLETFDFKFQLAGHTMKDLHNVLGIVLPDTPQYKLAGHLHHEGNDFRFDPFQGTVGDSDLRGQVTFRKQSPRPLFVANLQSKLLDLKDLGPVVGTPKKDTHEKTPAEAAQAEAQKASDKALPQIPFSTEKWDKMDADVKLVAERVMRPKQLPVDKLSTHLVMKDAVLTLQPLDFGMAGGRFTSNVVIDSHQDPPLAKVKGEVQDLQLAQLFPAAKSMEESLGHLYGRVDLQGRGKSVGDMLGTANGKAVVAANGGRVSDLLTQLLEIDVAHALMVLGTRNKQVELRCAVGDLDVKDGVVTPESFIADTTETNIKIAGKLDLGQERLEVETKGRGKTPSAFTLHAPILIEGPLKKPKVHPKMGPLAAQVGAAVALGAVAAPLAIAPFVEPGRGKDADCDELLAQAHGKGAHDRTKTANR